MYTLTNFNNTPSDFHLQADVYRDGSFFKIVYQLSDLKKLLTLPAPFSKAGDQVLRKDGLWNNTCFEMFLQPKSQTSYYEFNFSLDPNWNQYYFESYRTPQPPQPSSNFELKNIQWDGFILEVELNTNLNFAEVDISLTAVLKEKKGNIHYFAANNAGSAPDFHNSESFILKR